MVIQMKHPLNFETPLKHPFAVKKKLVLTKKKATVSDDLISINTILVNFYSFSLYCLSLLLPRDRNNQQ